MRIAVIHICQFFFTFHLFFSSTKCSAQKSTCPECIFCLWQQAIERDVGMPCDDQWCVLSRRIFRVVRYVVGELSVRVAFLSHVPHKADEISANVNEANISHLRRHCQQQILCNNNKQHPHLLTICYWNSWYTAIELTQEIGRRISAVTEDNRETTFLFQRLSIALQRGNAVSFQNTMNTTWNVVTTVYIV